MIKIILQSTLIGDRKKLELIKEYKAKRRDIRILCWITVGENIWENKIAFLLFLILGYVVVDHIFLTYAVHKWVRFAGAVIGFISIVAFFYGMFVEDAADTARLGKKELRRYIQGQI
jgi:hypothetical protein